MRLHDDLQIDIATLFYALMIADGARMQSEEALIQKYLQKLFEIDGKESIQLIEAAEIKFRETTDLIDLCRNINTETKYSERVALLFHCWEIALKDSLLDVVERRYLEIIIKGLRIDESDRRKVQEMVTKKKKFSEGRGNSVEDYEKDPKSWLRMLFLGTENVALTSINKGVMDIEFVSMRSTSTELIILESSIKESSVKVATRLNFPNGSVLIHGTTFYRAASLYFRPTKIVVEDNKQFFM